MIELVAETRIRFGGDWTPEDRAIMRFSYGARTMAAHDLTDALNMLSETRMGQYLSRLTRAANAPYQPADGQTREY